MVRIRERQPGAVEKEAQKMKQPRKPTLAEKKKMSEAGLNWKEWNVSASISSAMVLVRKKTGERKVLPL